MCLYLEALCNDCHSSECWLINVSPSAVLKVLVFQRVEVKTYCGNKLLAMVLVAACFAKVI